tara:strand:+ start:1541 stop:2491 length:951 start_codon:yes stop_codon:yes gene_type:complete
MMYVASCPLRISLFGGSTDNPFFVDKYGRGSVISFTSNLKTYITLHEDKIGFNKEGRKYIVNYSKREETGNVEDIQNDPVRIVLNHFGCHPMSVTMKSDAYSQGSGLASSSSYIISLIKCISMYYNMNLTDIEICELAYKLELQMNPYCGYQDPYGCGIGGFKKIDFEKGGIIKYDFLSQDLFRHYDMHLIFTGVTRNSRNVLKSVTDNIHKVKPLLKTADEAFDSLIKKDYDKFLDLMRKSWKQKKETTSAVTENSTIRTIDENLTENKTVVAHRLCGAGNGGFFLTFSEKDTLKTIYEPVRVHVTPQGVSGVII